MKILIDTNLSPDWTTVFKGAGFEALHWTEVGNFQATDQEILSWAADHAYVLFTHDLDFGSILAATGTC
ncbi:DUF5615 family PIN-like protein [bacterium]|nr:DUF5615 family PIN-like protein [bacterium]MCI0607144.1 DUF5615 family PIN-like protein [bacterium]